MRWPVLLGLLGGCFSPSPPAGAPCPNGVCPSGLVCSPASMTCEKTAVDAAAVEDAMFAPEGIPAGCYGAGLLTVCPDNPVTGNTQLVVTNTQSLLTTNSPLCLPYHLVSGMPDSTYCVVAAKTVSIGALGRLAVTGTRPLVLIGTMSLTVDGLIDAASHRNGTTGPNANAADCVPGGITALDAGGPGGSFGTVGGDGGPSMGNLKVLAGAAVPKPLVLRGGCRGADGNGGNRGEGGDGGGAVYLIADTLKINGAINASGESGDGAGLSAGGGGGGSGGMIVLDAQSITVSALARIFANGAGGGEGGGGSNGGNDGTDSTGPAALGLGGGGNAGAGGDGGDGAAGTTPAELGGTGDDSGGGGGGGAGVIRVFPAQMLGGSISPPAT